MKGHTWVRRAVSDPVSLSVLMEGSHQEGAKSADRTEHRKIVLRGADVGKVKISCSRIQRNSDRSKLISTSPTGLNKMSRITILSVPKSQHHVINPANPSGALDDGVEYGLHIRRRAADNAEYFGRGVLMIFSLAQFCVALLDFLEQANILDRDYRLIGEGFKKRNLFVSERSNLRPANDKRADSYAFT